MPTTLQFRRGTATQNDAFTGSVGELTIDTTNKTVRVHDGATAGGTRIATYAEAQSGGSGGSGLDSAAVLALISAGYIQTNQIKYTTVDFPDSAGVSAIITADVDASFIAALGTSAIPNLPTSKITSGTFADARIAASNVTQHQASLSITESQISDLGSYITASSTDTLTNKSISAGQINSGTLDSARIPVLAATDIASGTIDSARIPGLSASDIVTGTIDSARLPVGTFTTGGGGSSDIDSAQVSSIITADVDAAFVAALGTSAIPNLATSKITSGIFDSARIPVLSASDITSGTIDSARLPAGTFGGGSGGSPGQSGGSGGSGGIDSAAVIGLVDSAYVQARQASGSGTDPIFKTISVAGQSDVVADTTADTLTLVGSGVAITTNAGTDTITFTASIPVVDTDFVDSARVSSIITADVDASFINALTIDADTLGGQNSAYHLNYNNFSNTPTIPSLGNSFIDSAEAIKLITANAIDSSVALQLLLDSIETIALIDSAHVRLRQDFAYASLTGAPTIPAVDTDFVDSARVSSIITADVDASFINALTIDADTLGGQNSAYHLNYNNFTNTPTIPAIDTNFVDSARVSSIITADVDAAFVAALGTSAIPNLPTSKITSGTFDSARIPDLAAADITSGTIDSARIPALAAGDITSGTIDSARIPPTDNANKLSGQAGSYYLDYTNFSNTPTIPTLGTDFVDSAETNTLIDARVTNTFLRGLIDDSVLTVDGNGSTGGVTVQDGGITIRTGTGSVAYADFYCEVSNAHRTRLKSAAHSDYSGNVDITLPTTTGTLALTSQLPVIDTDFVDSVRVSSIITADVDAAFVAALGTSAIPNLPTSKITSGTFDSARIPVLSASDIVTGIIDSDRLPTGTFGGGGGGSSLTVQEEGSSLSTAATTLNFVGSGVTASGTGATKTITVTAGGLDSADVRNIIQGDAGLTQFAYTVTSANTTSFSGNDNNGNSLSYNANTVAVFLNGVLLVDSDDYSATNGTSVTLVTGADSDDVLTVFNIPGGKGLDSGQVSGLVDSAYVQARQESGVTTGKAIAMAIVFGG